MINILKKILLLLILTANIAICYYDYYYYQSFYHSLIILGLLVISYCTYKIISILNDLLHVFKKWLGH
jgi:hypothetical protein